MITKQVTLSTGVTVAVAPVPQKIYDVIRMKHPDPPVPTVEGDLMGEAFRRENTDDADYQRSMMEAAQARQMAWAEAMFLFGLPEVIVPQGGKCPECQFVCEEDPEVSPYCCPACLQSAQGDIDVNGIAMERYIWEPPIEELAYIAPDWKPREGTKGRTLDYIEWELLRTPGDHQKVIAAINALAMVPEEAVDAVEDTFPSDVEVQGTGEEQARDTD